MGLAFEIEEFIQNIPLCSSSSLRNHIGIEPISSELYFPKQDSNGIFTLVILFT